MEAQSKANPETAKAASLNQINMGGGNEGAAAAQAARSQPPSEQPHQNEDLEQEQEIEEAASNLMSS